MRARLRAEGAVLLRLAGPLAVAQLSHVGMSFTDTVMAGRLLPLDLAAIAIGAMLLVGVYLLFFGLLNAAAPIIAQHKGAGRDREVGVAFRQGLWLAAGLAVLSVPVTIHARELMGWVGTVPDVAALAGRYLYAVAWGMPATCIFLVARFTTEGTGNTRPVMYINLFGLALNALANYAFMFGRLGAPAMGAVGCGVATTIVMWVDLLLLLAYLALHPRYRPYALFQGWHRPDWSAIVAMMRLGVPIALGIMTEVMMFLGVGLMMSTLGTLAMAAHQVAHNFVSLVFMVPLSIGIAIMIRVGHLSGAGDLARAQLASYVGVGMAALFMACMATLIFIAPDLIVRLYTDVPEVSVLAIEILFFAAVFQVSDGVNIALVHALRGLKDAFVPMLMGVVSYWMIGLASAWYLGIHRAIGPVGLWMGLIGGLTISCLFTFLRLRVVLRRAMASP